MNEGWSLLPHTLRGKLVLWVAGLAVAGAIAFGIQNWLFNRNAAEEALLAGLVNEAQVVSNEISGAIRDLENDLAIVSATPPIEGLMRSLAAGDIDPLDGSTTAEWQQRLRAIFNSIVNLRPQIREFSLVQEGGRVLASSVTGSLEARVSQADMLLAGTQVLENDAGQLVVRSVREIPGSQGGIFARLVLEADYFDALGAAFTRISPDHDILIATSNGVIAEWRGSPREIVFLQAADLDERFAAVVERVVPGANVTADIAAGYHFASVSMGLGTNDDAFFISTIVLTDQDAVQQYVAGAVGLNLMTLLAVVLACALLALFVTQRLTRPLEEMKLTIQRAQSDGRVLEFPFEGNDEFGELASSFSSLAKELQEGELRQRAVFESIIDALIVIDHRGVIESFNPAAERIFGYSQAEIVGKNVSSLMPEPDRSAHDGYLHAYQQGGAPKIIGIGREVVALRKDGSEFPAELSVTELNLPGRQLYSGLIRDISERKQMEIIKTEFISTVNHELRTPLTSIVGSLTILKAKTADQLDTKSARLLTLASEGAERLANLINDILDIEKIAAGKMEYELAPHEIGKLVTDVVAAHHGLEEKYGIAFRTIVDIEEENVRLDVNRFYQALGNLLSNASRYSPQDETVVVRVTLQGPKHVRIEVEDNGPGVPEDFHDKIFGRFAQASTGDTRAEGGSGLGLNITRTLIEAFDGQVGFESVPGEGANFYFVLPVCDEVSDDG